MILGDTADINEFFHGVFEGNIARIALLTKASGAR